MSECVHEFVEDKMNTDMIHMKVRIVGNIHKVHFMTDGGEYILHSDRTDEQIKNLKATNKMLFGVELIDRDISVKSARAMWNTMMEAGYGMIDCEAEAMLEIGV